MKAILELLRTLLAKVATRAVLYGLAAVLGALAGSKALTPEQEAAGSALAEGIVAVALLLAAALLDRWHHKADLAQMPPAAGRASGVNSASILWPLLLLPLVLGAGCAAPMGVRGAHDLSAEAMRIYSANVGRTLDMTLKAYEIERNAASEAATEASLALIAEAVQEGQAPGDVVDGVRALVAEREAAASKTAELIGRIRGLETANRAELAKALQLHGAVAEWLEAGVDSSVVPTLLGELEGLIHAARRQNP